MTRRHFIGTFAAAAPYTTAPAQLVVPIHRVMDSRAQCSPEQLHHFWSVIWPVASPITTPSGNFAV